MKSSRTRRRDPETRKLTTNVTKLQRIRIKVWQGRRLAKQKDEETKGGGGVRFVRSRCCLCSFLRSSAIPVNFEGNQQSTVERDRKNEAKPVKINGTDNGLQSSINSAVDQTPKILTILVALLLEPSSPTCYLFANFRVFFSLLNK